MAHFKNPVIQLIESKGISYSKTYLDPFLKKNIVPDNTVKKGPKRI